jgi:cytochrome P450
VPTYPKTRHRDALRLLGRLLVTRLRGGDGAETAADWLREQTDRYDNPDIVIDLIVRRILFVSSRALSAHVLAAEPSVHTIAAGTMKRKAMSFLAPHALTIAHDSEWRALRTYNEAVLQHSGPHTHLPVVLSAVWESFAGPVEGILDIRRRMGQVMLALVFGKDTAPAHLIDDIQELFAEVNLKTALFRSRKKALRDRFKGELRRLWQSGAGATEPALLARAHEAATSVDRAYASREALVDQIPHWMFTFTNSGSDLLYRSLAMITARPETLAEVRREIDAAGELDVPEKVNALRSLEACILETGRLFPPVAIVTHRSMQATVFQGRDLPAGTEMLQYFPFGNRDMTRVPLASHFWPERWLDPEGAAFRECPNLFLSGARACPGRSLIMFVEKAALALLLRDGRIPPPHEALKSDPLPFSFPT